MKEPAWTIKTLGSEFWLHLLASWRLFFPLCLFFLKEELASWAFCFCDFNLIDGYRNPAVSESPGSDAFP